MREKHWTDSLPADACDEAREWALTQPDYKTAWQRCKRGDLRSRFMAKVRPGESGCWEWTANKTRTGYGMFSVDGKGRKASRVSWEFSFGEIPTGLHVLHSCDNRACVNPAHLRLGTHQDNMNDKCFKNRQSRTGNRIFAAKTHCPSGHEYSPANTKVYRGMRYCNECSRRHKANYKAKIKGTKDGSLD